MSIRASLRGGNARHPVQAIPLAFSRTPGRSGQLIFSCLKVAVPLALMAGLVIIGSTHRAGPSPIAALAEPGGWGAPTASVPAAAASGTRAAGAAHDAAFAASAASPEVASEALSVAAAESVPDAAAASTIGVRGSGAVP